MNYTSTQNYTIVLEESDEGGFLVHIPACNNATTQGATIKEALERAEDLIRCFVGSRVLRGLPLPVETKVTSPLNLTLELNVPMAA